MSLPALFVIDVDSDVQVEAVWDSALASTPTWRVCAGCTNPKDHSQHKVVDIAVADLLKIVKAGGRPEPRVADIQ